MRRHWSRISQRQKRRKKRKSGDLHVLIVLCGRDDDAYDGERARTEPTRFAVDLNEICSKSLVNSKNVNKKKPHKLAETEGVGQCLSCDFFAFQEADQLQTLPNNEYTVRTQLLYRATVMMHHLCATISKRRILNGISGKTPGSSIHRVIQYAAEDKFETQVKPKKQNVNR